MRAAQLAAAWLACLALVGLPRSAGADPGTDDEPGFLASLGDRVHWSGKVQVRFAPEFSGPAQALELRALPELEVELPAGMLLKAKGRLRADWYDRLDLGSRSQPTISGESRRRFFGDHVDLELRELFLEAEIGTALLSVGKQATVWGTSDGLKVVDVVNPQSFREFILPDFEVSRIPLWSANVEVPISDVNLELVWIPDLTYHELPERGSLYEFTSERLVPPIPSFVTLVEEPIDRPKRIFKDSDAGVRLSTFWKGWDLTLSYLYHYEDTPVFFGELSIDTEIRVTVRPSYERTHSVAGTFSNAFGNLTVRGEVGYSSDLFFQTEDFTDPDFVVESGGLSYVVGFDWFGFSNTILSLQVFQRWIFSYETGILQEEFTTNLSFYAARSFRNETIVADLMWIGDYDDGDGVIRPKIHYEFNDSFAAWLGVDVFYGTDRGVFGQYDDRDRAVIGAEWRF